MTFSPTLFKTRKTSFLGLVALSPARFLHKLGYFGAYKLPRRVGEASDRLKKKHLEIAFLTLPREILVVLIAFVHLHIQGKVVQRYYFFLSSKAYMGSCVLIYN